MLWRRYDVMFWALSHLALVMLTHHPNNRTGWLILSNHAYPLAHLCFNQSECIMWLYLLIVRVSHDHVTSHDCPFTSCEVSQSRDIQSRKLKAIKYSVRDNHLDNLKRTMSSGRKLCGWLAGLQVASFKLSWMLYLIAFNFLSSLSRDCGILHMMLTDSHDLSHDHETVVL